MESFAAFKNKWVEMMSKDGIVVDNGLRKDFEDEMFHLFLTIDSTLQDSNKTILAKDAKLFDVYGKLDNAREKLNELQEVLNTKNDELIKTMAKSHDFENELYVVKDSARSIVKYLNMSLKASSNIIARTIIEMVARDQMHQIDLSVENLIYKFCQKYGCSRRDRTILESLTEMEKKGFLDRISKQEKEDVDLVMKWSRQRQEKKYFLPTNDLLKRIWMRAKSNEIVTLLSHPILGTFTAEHDKIEKSFFDLYKTLSEIAHTYGLNYEQDVLPIPDVDESNFKKVDALALASFYSICLPKVPYEIVTRVVNHPEDPFQLISNVKTNVITTCSNTNHPAKRKFIEDEDRENATD